MRANDNRWCDKGGAFWFCGLVLLWLRVMPRREWGFDEDLSQVLWRQLLRGPRPPSVQWPHSRRNMSAVDHQVPAAKKGKGRGSGPAKGVGKGSHQQAPRHNAAPKQRVPMPRWAKRTHSRSQGSNSESARGSKFGHDLREGGGKFARRGRRLSRLQFKSIQSAT